MSRATPLYNESELAKTVFGKAGLDAIIVRSGQNVAYLSGMRFPGTLGRLQDFVHSPRGAIVVMSPNEEPTLIVSRIAAGVARQWSWVEDLSEFTEYIDSPYALAASALRKRRLADKRIGIERRLMTATQWEGLRAELPRAELVDCTDLLEGVRNMKTASEVAILKHGADVQDDAYLEVFQSARAGDTERELHARMIAGLLRRGVESAHGIMQSSRNPVTVYGGESDVPVEQGDLLRTDYVSYSEGYAANLTRMAVMGPPSPAQQERYAILVDIHRGLISHTIRPGATAADVYDSYRQRCVDAGYPKVNSLVGHHVGVWWHQEEPMLVPGEPRTLEPGMVICLEPVVDGYWHLQDELLITAHGCDLLSDRFDTDTLFVMGG